MMRAVKIRVLSALAALAALATAAVAIGCGNGEEGAPRHRATLVLDFTPNAVHSGIYSAKRRKFFAERGVKLRIREPSSSADPLKLVSAGRTEFALADIHDVGLAVERGLDLVGVMAIVERPLSSLIALKSSGIKSPSELEGKPVGVTGVPSDDAVLESIVSSAGGDPEKVKRVTIGFKAVGSLIAGKVDAATAFWNAEGVALKRRGFGVTEFRVDGYGAPHYPELVLITSRKLAKKRPELVRAVVGSLVRGYRFTLTEPEASLDDLVNQVPGLERGLMKDQLDALLPIFKAKAKSVGFLDPEVLKDWGSWDVRFGILKRRPPIEKTFTNDFLPR